MISISFMLTLTGSWMFAFGVLWWSFRCSCSVLSPGGAGGGSFLQVAQVAATPTPAVGYQTG